MALIDVINSLQWGGVGQPQYAGVLKSGPGEAEKSAQQGRIEDRADANRQEGIADEQTSELSGPTTQDTPMYKRMMSLSTEDTARTYDQARAVRARRANAAGFGQGQPIKEADDRTVDSMQARDIGNLPREVAGDVEQERLQSANLHAGMAGQRLSSGNQELQTWSSAEEARKKRNASMWGKIAGVGLTAAGIGLAPFSGGTSLALTGAGAGLMKSS